MEVFMGLRIMIVSGVGNMVDGVVERVKVLVIDFLGGNCEEGEL